MTEPSTPRGPASHYNRDGSAKHRFPNKRIARVAIRRQFSATSRKLATYICGECQGWHLTSSPKRSEP